LQRCISIPGMKQGAKELYATRETACSVGWWLMASAGLFWEKSTVGWFVPREKYYWLVDDKPSQRGMSLLVRNAGWVCNQFRNRFQGEINSGVLLDYHLFGAHTDGSRVIWNAVANITFVSLSVLWISTLINCMPARSILWNFFGKKTRGDTNLSRCACTPQSAYRFPDGKRRIAMGNKCAARGICPRSPYQLSDSIAARSGSFYSPPARCRSTMGGRVSCLCARAEEKKKRGRPSPAFVTSCRPTGRGRCDPCTTGRARRCSAARAAWSTSPKGPDLSAIEPLVFAARGGEVALRRRRCGAAAVAAESYARACITA
jgi:hypothetical protein